MPNWWEPLMDSAQPSWAPMLQAEQAVSPLGAFGLDAPQVEVNLDMWGNPIEEETETEDGAGAEEERCEADICDVVDCRDPAIAALAEQLEQALEQEGKELCDLVDCSSLDADTCKAPVEAPIGDVQLLRQGAFNATSPEDGGAGA